MCSFTSPEQVLGKSPKMLQGAATDGVEAAHFAARAARGGEARTALVNYKADGEAFLHMLRTSAFLNDETGGAFILACSEGRELSGMEP